MKAADEFKGQDDSTEPNSGRPTSRNLKVIGWGLVLSEHDPGRTSPATQSSPWESCARRMKTEDVHEYAGVGFDPQPGCG